LSRRRVVVIGAGAAGAAAAFAASRAGAAVTIVKGRGGATALSSGALDACGPGDTEIAELLHALGVWELPADGCRVATLSGVLRPAAGKDAAVLDLARIRGTVGVVRTARRGWDADGLVRAYNAEPWAAATGVRFAAVDVDVLRTTDEHWFPDVDLALCHDEPGRVTWLGERLGGAPSLADKAAVLLGPWLGTTENSARALSGAVGRPVGETLSLPGGVAGVRFERARDRLLSSVGVEVVEVCAVSIDQHDGVALESGAMLAADAVILATGGLLGGGLAWAHGGAFTSSVKAPVALGLGGRRLDRGASPFGTSFEQFAWSGRDDPAGFERVGVLASPSGHVLGDGREPLGWLYVAGDVAADRPRTLLEALRAGLSAGRSAASGSL
jgi:glycine/D-amino acid oxidase-like deaminating enzyme